VAGLPVPAIWPAPTPFRNYTRSRSKCRTPAILCRSNLSVCGRSQFRLAA